MHPVFAAFTMSHLDPDEHGVLRRCSIRIAVVYAALALPVFMAAALPCRSMPPDIDRIASQEQVATQAERDEADADGLGDDQGAPERPHPGLVGEALFRRHLLANGGLPGVEAR